MKAILTTNFTRLVALAATGALLAALLGVPGTWH